MELTVKFDYSELSELNAIFIREKTAGIKVLVKQTAQGIIEIGQELSIVKSRLPHGSWLPWLEAEFGWSDSMANRFMRVGCNFKSVKLTDLDIAPSALYALAAPSTPESAREEAIERAESGEQITHKQAKEIVELHKVRKEQQAKIDKLESDLKSAQSMIPTEDVKQIIRDLTDEIEDLKAAPPKVQTVEKPVLKIVEPDDYQGLKKELEKKEQDLIDLQKAIESSKKSVGKIKNDSAAQVNRIENLVGEVDRLKHELSQYDYKKREVKALNLLGEAQKRITTASALFADDRGNRSSMSGTLMMTVNDMMDALSQFQKQSDVIDIEVVN